MDIEYINIEEYLENCFLNCYIASDNETYIKILHEEKERASLSGINIFLFIPETPEDMDPYLLGSSIKFKDCYEIRLNPSPRIRRKYEYDERNTIRHELAHIKYGDCDRRLPPILKKIYHSLIEEPRANFYARESRLLFLYEPLENMFSKF